MYSPLGGHDHGQSSFRESIQSYPNSILDNNDYSQSVELGDLSSTALLQDSTAPYQNHDAKGNGNSYKNIMPLVEDADASLAEARDSTRPGAGWWTHQMLVDRSTRTMAVCMTAFAFIMLCACVALALPFSQIIEKNKQSTSVTIATGSRSAMNHRSEALKFFVNIAATMVLGMSNTYQQILTALSMDDLKHVLSKYGDSRVGTNSPFAINQKRKGRAIAWAGWLSLIMTSLPIHLLANSLVGVSQYQQYNYDLPVILNKTRDSPMLWNGTYYHYTSGAHFDCFTTFRLGKGRMLWSDPYVYLEDQGYIGDDFGRCRQELIGKDPPKQKEECYDSVSVTYDEERCGQYVNQTFEDPTTELLAEYYHSGDSSRRLTQPLIGECYLDNITCHYNVQSGSGPCSSSATYRLVVRMQAAVILAFCLVYKACYMLSFNIRSKGKTKTHLLTYGDVLMASVLDPTVQIPHESMVNGGSFHRRQVYHICHQHCKNRELSVSGDELGHCQKCSKLNKVNNMTRLAWPAVATKRKESLLANLGQTALTQMLTLSFSSVGMVVASVFALIAFILSYADAVRCKWTTYTEQMMKPHAIAELYKHDLTGELLTFIISNGAQLLYSMLYLLLIYNVTLISMEQEWGLLEKQRKRLRCTIVKSKNFDQSYLLQLPKQWLFPLMTYSIMMHWLLGLAIYAEESTIGDGSREFSKYTVVTVPAGLLGSTALMLVMTVGCWWAFTYKREGFIPQMYGSIRVLCSATTHLHHHPAEGILWGDLGKSDNYRHAGLSGGDVQSIVPNELYA